MGRDVPHLALLLSLNVEGQGGLIKIRQVFPRSAR
jgi:hypothetical protein